MERQSSSQLELFSETGVVNDSSKKPVSRNPILTRIWNHEKTILVVISVLLVGIISFSLGVEKGKRMVLAVQVNPEVAKDALSANPVSVPQVQILVKKEEVLKASNPITQQGSFTIQVASFKTKDSAQREAEFLKKKGFSTLFINKNSYIVLCVGNFPNKETALPLLSELNKRYRSCYIRRL
ncbi:MAG: SPOR domain-containing protein [Candidatus Omnitrophica bacterium]|nr:SPOR domain-containing protein [Candidatus Omnitrophota bacterium]